MLLLRSQPVCLPTCLRSAPTHHSPCLQWLNEMLEEVWPYVDGAVCKEVKVRKEGRGS